MPGQDVSGFRVSLRRSAKRLWSASLSPVADAGLRFLRTMVMSRLLSPHDLGAATALMAVLFACEMVTDVGLEKFVLTNAKGERAQVVAVARQITMARAVMLAAAIAALAPVLATIFGVSEQSRLVAWLGLIPLVHSLRSWRVVQVQLDYRYGPDAIITAAGRVAGIAALLAASALFRDARLIVVALGVEAAVMVAMSYVVARPEPVRAIDPAIRRDALRFGLPLMANGVGLATLRQTDQAIVANLFGLATLAQYALALNLAVVPTSILQQVSGKLALPLLTRAHGNPTRSREASVLVALGMLVAAAALAVTLGSGLDWLVPAIYGPAYRVDVSFIALATLIMFLRFSRGAPNLLLLQHGRTGRVTAGNLVTGVGLLAGLLLASKIRTLGSVLVGVVAGEVLSLALLTLLCHRLVPLRTIGRHGTVLGLAVVVTSCVLWLRGCTGAGTIDWTARAVVLGGAISIIGIDALILFVGKLRPFLDGEGRPTPAGVGRPAFAALGRRRVP